MYKATIRNKEIKNGVLMVTVEYKDETINENFTDKVQTSQSQKKGWIEEQIKLKLQYLNGLQETETYIVIDKEITADTEVIGSLTDKEIYKNDLALFNKMVDVTMRGFLSRDNTDFLALKKKLKDNFKIEYLDLF